MNDITSFNSTKFMNKLEGFYGALYPQGQKVEIIKRFSSLIDEQLVTLYDALVSSFRTKPALSEILACWEKATRAASASAAPAAYSSNSARSPWEARTQKASKEAKDYARWAMDNEPAWQQAAAEGWRSEALLFVEHWARAQSLAIQGAEGIAVSRDMLGWPLGDQQYDDRINEMRAAIKDAVARNSISVPTPDWLVAYGREFAARKSRDLVPAGRSVSRVIAATAQELKSTETPEQPAQEHRQASEATA